MSGLATVVLFVATISSYAVIQSSAFVPNRFFAWTLNGVSFSFKSTVTHKDMTRNAILDVAVDLLRDNPNPNNQGSSSRIASLSDPSEKDIVRAYYGSTHSTTATRNFKSAIELMQSENSKVDLGAERKLAHAHFDGETFQAGHNRLVELREGTVSQILMENYEAARRFAGRMFHTLQDFYSHSNWIENGNEEPYSVLGRRNQRPENIATPNEQTCEDCVRDGRDIVGLILSVFADSARNSYRCQDNIASSLNGKLTSGYHAGQKDSDGQTITKPRGKCSHGDFLDATSDSFATGGINKDSPFKKWSPHYYLYDEAVMLAQQATFDMLQELRREVNDDEMFAAFLGLTLTETTSIAYVIDTTGSMEEELPEIQATIPQIRTSLQQYVNGLGGNVRVRYILVPFNDPGILS